jgi:hypothetical protein
MPRPASLAWLAPILAVLLAAVPAAAEEAPAEKKRTREATPEEAAPLVKDLKTAAGKKKAAEALPLLEKIVELTHPDFEKPLVKLLTHPDAQVAIRAAELLEDRVGKDSGKSVWAAGWAHATNDKRLTVRSKSLRPLGKIGYVLDKRQYDDVESTWRSLTANNPRPDLVAVLVDIAYYFETSKDKRLCRLLAEELDEPVSTSPNSPTNPPAAWWEARWKVWKEAKPAAVAALKAITGHEFDSTEAAKKWFEENKKDFGFDW